MANTHMHIDEHTSRHGFNLGRGAPPVLESSVLLTLAGAGMALIGLPFAAFGGNVQIFGLILLLSGVASFLYGAVTGGAFIISGYVRDFRKHWRPRYKKALLTGALAGLFFSLPYLPAAPILMIVCAAVAVHFVRKASGDTAFPAFPAEDSDTRQR